MLKHKEKITVVISTYNRPDVLSVAIKSVILQTFFNWKILVIADNCDQETEKVITSFNDERIEYINLPYRVGEQSGPNSVGIALTTTEYLAFMNQDDIWLQDHLEQAIEILEKTNSDFFLGKCIFAHHSKDTDGRSKVPIFDWVNPDYRTADMSFDKENKLFESASSWVIKTSHAKRIGYWKQYREIHRTPLQNWITRAWRKNTKFVFGEKITVLKINTHNRIKGKPKYSEKSLEHVYLLDLLENKNSNSMRKIVEKSLELNKKFFSMEVFKNKKSYRVLSKILFNRLTKSLFVYTGVDSYEIFFNLLRGKKNRIPNKMSLARTGKPLPEKVDIKMVIDKVKLHRDR